MARRLNWFALRVMYVFSPMALVVSLALAVDGRLEGALIVGVVAVVMFRAGHRTRGQWTTPPG